MARREPPGKGVSRADAGALAGRGQAGHDRQRHLLAGRLAAHAAGEPNIVEKVKAGYTAGGKTWKVHLDGYNFLPCFKGEVKKAPREETYHFGAGGELNAVRWNDWKVHFAVQNGNIATAVREVPGLTVIVNPRADPYEKAPHELGMYIRWYADNIWLFVPVQQKLGAFLKTLPEFPFQQGSSLNASNINYTSLKAMEAMKRLGELENFVRPPRN
jgi:arylsulfatase